MIISRRISPVVLFFSVVVLWNPGGGYGLLYAADDLEITNLTPSGYEVAYNGLNIGAVEFVDRTYIFNSVPSAYRGKTYIKTANDDKGSTGSSFVTFDINRGATVYVAHDDRINPKPSWMSDFIYTGDNLVSSDSSNTFSLYAKVFVAGTVTLGGNYGSSASMYSVVVVERSNLDIAWHPSPADGKQAVPVDSDLGWSPGDSAVSHDVYFGMDEASVESAGIGLAGDITGNGPVNYFDLKVLSEQWLTAPGSPSADLNDDGDVNFADYVIFANDWMQSGSSSVLFMGNQTGTTFDPCTLASDTTYYWRVDEVNSTEPASPWKGEVWSFTTAIDAEDMDLYSDTWVATDALDRELVGYNECGPPREDRYVGVFYFLWLGEHGTGGPYDVTDLLAANPSNPSWGPEGAPHHWGESELGYYLSDDEYVMRKHAHMLADAGVDVIVFDVTNGWTYESNYKALCQVFMDIRAEGGTTPQIAFLANAYADNVVTNVYNALYSQNLYPDLWFYWKGKPLILAPLNGMEILGRTITYSQEIKDFFNMRYSWAFNAAYDNWPWIDHYPQDYGWHESSSIPEELSVAMGHWPHSNIGRSFSNGSQPSHNQYGLTGSEHLGLNFAEQLSRLNTIDPEFLFITGWNEWVAGRRVFTGSGDPVTHFIGDPLQPGDTWFVDAYNQEYSRDAEPMKGGHTDNYYYQMIDGIRRYKGVRQPPTTSAAKTISIDGSFSDWDDVGPTFRDTTYDTTHRNETGWGSAGTYVNTTGRNDFKTLKASRDENYVYFYAKTRENLTSYTDSNWMLLFIDADQNHSTGWEGYDYIVNMTVNSSTSTTLKSSSGGWSWTTVNSNIAYRASGNQLELRIPRFDIGEVSDVALDFHWADNIQHGDDIIEFSVSGDSAPDRRFNYRYEHYAAVPTILNPSFEYPNISGYVYEPSGTDWSHSGGGFVIADSGSAFGNTAYQGGQNMVMQQVVSVWQSLSGFEIGQEYTVSWAEADRPGAGGNDLRVWLDGTVVGSLHTVTDDSWNVRTSSTFQATSTTHTLKFETLNSGGGDRSVFIDYVTISAD